MLHSGSMLGDLPSLDSHRKKSLSKDQKVDGIASPKGIVSQHDGGGGGGKFSKRGSRGGGKGALEMPPGFPPVLRCAIGERPLKDAVRSPYGHFFERNMIERWIRDNGSVCPLTGQPLGSAELMDAPEVRAAVDEWYAVRARRLLDEQLATSEKRVPAAAVHPEPTNSCGVCGGGGGRAESPGPDGVSSPRVAYAAPSLSPGSGSNETKPTTLVAAADDEELYDF